MAEAPRADDLLDTAIADGWATGWQLAAIRVDDAGIRTLIDRASGVDALEQSVTPQSRFSTYCTIKPLVAIGAARAVDDGELSWDDTLDDLIDTVNPSLGSRSVRQLLDHTAGALVPEAGAATRTPRDERLPSALRAEPTPLPQGASAYSEAAGWMVAGAALAASVDRSLIEYVTEHVLAPLELIEDFDLGHQPADDGRLRVNLSTRSGRRWPSLIERTSALDWVTNPGYGGRSTTRGLVALAAEVVAAKRGSGRVLSVAAANALTAPSAATRDLTWERDCTFGLGWLVQLEQHRFGIELPSEAFATVGLVGMTAVWGDPSAGYAAGYHVNGISDGGTAIDWLRQAMVRAVKREVDSSTG